jgi:hypothetical protein
MQYSQSQERVNMANCCYVNGTLVGGPSYGTASGTDASGNDSADRTGICHASVARYKDNLYGGVTEGA